MNGRSGGKKEAAVRIKMAAASSHLVVIIDAGLEHALAYAA